jgi:hypothetical protein
MYGKLNRAFFVALHIKNFLSRRSPLNRVQQTDLEKSDICRLECQRTSGQIYFQLAHVQLNDALMYLTFQARNMGHRNVS